MLDHLTGAALHHSVALVTTLNRLAAGRLTAPESEQRIRLQERPHHVTDADGVLGLPDDEAVTLRRALARVDGDGALWALLLPAPGHLGGLRGPASVNRAGVDAGAVVVRHDGGAAWVFGEVGHGVQWTVVRAAHPMLPDAPRDASRTLNQALADASAGLVGNELAGDRPDVRAPFLGDGYGGAAESVFQQGWTVLHLADAGLAATAGSASSHQALTRERHLRALLPVARGAIASGASWPDRALV